MEWDEAQDVKEDLQHVLNNIDLPYIDITKIHCYRTRGSKVRAYARTWAFPKIFQRALDIKPAYVIEVLSKHYDTLKDDEKKKVLIHELLHIPKNFSGALLPHRTRSRNLHNLANQLFKEYKKKIDEDSSLRGGTTKQSPTLIEKLTGLPRSYRRSQ